MNRRDFFTGLLAGPAAVARLHLDTKALEAIEPREDAYWLPAIEEGRELLDLIGPDNRWAFFPGLRHDPDGVKAVQYLAERVEGGWRLVEVQGGKFLVRHMAHERR